MVLKIGFGCPGKWPWNFPAMKATDNMWHRTTKVCPTHLMVLGFFLGQGIVFFFSFLWHCLLPLWVLRRELQTLQEQPWDSLLSRQQRKSLVIHRTSCETNGTDCWRSHLLSHHLFINVLSLLFYGCKGKGWLELPWAALQWVPLCQLGPEVHGRMSLCCGIWVRVYLPQVLGCLFKAGRNPLDTFTAGWVGQTVSSAVLCDLPKESPGLCLEWFYRCGGCEGPWVLQQMSFSVGKECEWKLYKIALEGFFDSNIVRKSCWIVLRMCHSLLS